MIGAYGTQSKLLTSFRLLRAELQNLRKRGALKTGSSLDRPVIIESNRSCARCRTYLGRIINRGAPCRACKLRVCKTCREFTNRTDWICVVCNKQMWVKHTEIVSLTIFFHQLISIILQFFVPLLKWGKVFSLVNKRECLNRLMTTIKVLVFWL